MTRFLVVDDHPATVMALIGLLTSDGHRVEAFTSGAEALEALSERSFDVVVTDLDMAGVGGAEVVKAARARLPGACVVVVSARGHEMEGALREAGASMVVDKPLDYEHFMHAVKATMPHASASELSGCLSPSTRPARAAASGR